MEAIGKKLEEWRDIRSLTIDLLETLAEDQLQLTVGNNMGSLGKQFRHIGDVQLCYNDGLKNGKIDFTKYRRDYSIEGSKKKLKEFLSEMDKDTKALTETNENTLVDWGFGKLSVTEHLNFLIQHEILHHGELIVYFRILSIPFPEKFKENWGL